METWSMYERHHGERVNVDASESWKGTESQTRGITHRVYRGLDARV